MSFFKLKVVQLDDFRYRDLHSVSTEVLALSSNASSNSIAMVTSRGQDLVPDNVEPDGDDSDYEFGLVHHYFDKDIVDLLDWEEQSLAGIMGPNATRRSMRDSCNPPPGISNVCCIGSFSTGGGVTDNNRIACSESMQPEALDALQKHTRQFFQENTLPNKTNSIACDACRIVDLARKNNLTIALMGDSMHNQIMDGLSCELQRRNYNVTVELIDHNPTRDVAWIFRRHTMTTLLHIQSPSWRQNETVTIEFHRMYLLPLITDDVAKVTANVDVLVGTAKDLCDGTSDSSNH